MRGLGGRGERVEHRFELFDIVGRSGHLGGHDDWSAVQMIWASYGTAAWVGDS